MHSAQIIKDRKLEKRTIIGAVMPEINKKVMALKVRIQIFRFFKFN